MGALTLANTLIQAYDVQAVDVSTDGRRAYLELTGAGHVAVLSADDDIPGVSLTVYPEATAEDRVYALAALDALSEAEVLMWAAFWLGFRSYDARSRS